MTNYIAGTPEQLFSPQATILEAPLSPALLPDRLLGNPNLPIAAYRAQIEEAIVQNSVTILVSPTGSGKTTQVPQYARGLSKNGQPLFDEIILTQPRIVAARTISERIADEISHTNEDHSVGYYTSKEATPQPQRIQNIAVLTDGKAAAQLLHGVGNKNPNSKKLLIIDEVHEWNLPIEMLVALAAQKTDPTSPHYDPNLKVVIMSATMDAQGLKKHFAHIDPPLIKITVPMFEVKHSVSNGSVADVSLDMANRTNGKVLTFLAGKSEIRALADAVEKRQHNIPKDRRVIVVPLHGQLAANQQKKAFEDYENGVIIAATNAAETSLTVPGAVGVVDSGEVRVDRIEEGKIPTGSTGLYLEDASQSSLRQRAGRVGRLAPGQEYVLCSQTGRTPPVPFNARPEYMTPSIQRTSLDGLVLQLKASGNEDLTERLFHKPSAQALHAAAQRLFVLGALDLGGNITERGLKMERLPLEPEYACMVLFAHENGYSAEVKKNILDIVAIMQQGGILKRGPKEQRWRELLEKDFDGNSKEQESDFFAQLEVYVELMQNVKRSKWEDYDIIERAADLVEQERTSLARNLKVDLHQVVTVDPKNRQTVLACINAGQLNQLWWPDGDGWQLLLSQSHEYDLSQSSVVKTVGKLATGALFSLGVRGDTFTAIQNVNSVPNNETLEKIAGHLTTDEYSDVTEYDPAKSALVVRVQRKLGPIALRTFTIEADAAQGANDQLKLQEGFTAYAWKVWPERKAKKVAYAAETIDQAIASPEAMQFGTNPVTGEPLVAYMGGKGQWCQTKEIATLSLEAQRQQLLRQPQREALRVIKAHVKAARTQLVALKNTDHMHAGAAKELLSRQNNTPEWLAQAQSILNLS